MLQNRATLHQIRFYVLEKLRQIYADKESDSMVRLIMDHVGYPLSAILRDPDHEPAPEILAQINEIIAEIRAGKPIQYVLGETRFFDLRIRVDARVLIPRPETEEMVEQIREQILKPVHRIIDLGTGSGCIALALKKQFPEAEVWGIDHSEDALELARENARLNMLQVNWTRLDLLDLPPAEPWEPFDLVVSNPPYVLLSEMQNMARHITDHEPGSALYVEDHDPLLFYRAIAAFVNRYISQEGDVWVEINERFGRETASLFKIQGFRTVHIRKDIHDKERYIHARK